MTGEGADGDVFVAARGDTQGTGSQLLRLRRVSAEDRDGGLNQEPAGVRVAGLGDRVAVLRVAGAVLAGHEAEVGFELMRVTEALGVVDRGEEGGGVTGPTQGTERNRSTRGSWTARCSIVASEYASCWLRGRMTASSGGTTERKRPGRDRA